jgi:DNA-binding transcriptional LysR family regulator
MFELRDLECFLTIVEQKSFHRAAKVLHSAQPPLSRRIAALERDLGAKLFTREASQVRLTQIGLTFAEEARAVLAQADLARRVVADLGRGFNGHIRLGYFGSAGYVIVPAALTTFREQYPRCTVSPSELLSLRQAEALRTGVIDVALHRGTPESDGLKARRLRSGRLVVALPKAHRLAKRDRIPMTELAREPFVALSAQATGGIPDLVRGVCARAGFVPNVVQEVDSIGILIACVAAEMGLALVNEGVRDVPFSTVVYREITPASPAVYVNVLTRANETNPLVPHLIDHLAAAALQRP